METNLQKILKSYDTPFDVARKYYTILFELNDIKVTKTELDMISYSAVHGTISTPPVREEFMKEFNVPSASVYNMISKLKKLHILTKEHDNKVRINPAILPDFSKNQLILAIKLNYGS